MGKIQIYDMNGQGPYTYILVNMHVHCHSEHSFDSQHYDLEMHFVHQLIDGPEGYENYS